MASLLKTRKKDKIHFFQKCHHFPLIILLKSWILLLAPYVLPLTTTNSQILYSSISFPFSSFLFNPYLNPKFPAISPTPCTASFSLCPSLPCVSLFSLSPLSRHTRKKGNALPHVLSLSHCSPSPEKPRAATTSGQPNAASPSPVISIFLSPSVFLSLALSLSLFAQPEKKKKKNWPLLQWPTASHPLPPPMVADDHPKQ